MEPLPLKLEQLFKMDGCPAYCIIPEDSENERYEVWGIIKWSGTWNEFGFYEADGGHQSPNELATRYKAEFYKRKPKGGDSD